MLRFMVAMAALASAGVGCSFSVTAASDGGGDDGGGDDDAAPLPVVGFAQTTNTQDESSGLVRIEVQLAGVASGPVSVAYSFSGDAMLGDDYSATAGTLTFAAGETSKMIDVMIVPDGIAEPTEAVVVTLDSPMGATLGAATHTMSIDANTLPRVTLAMASSMANEDQTVMFTVMLDKASTISTMVSYNIGGGSAQANGLFADYTLGGGVVMFPAGSLSQTLPLGVNNDMRDELTEDVTIILTASTGIVIGAQAAQNHLIVDDDATPSVRFAAATSTMTEGDAGIGQMILNVTLSAASGRAVVVPVSVTTGTSTATTPSDYTLGATTLTFVEGVASASVIIDVVGDLVNEQSEVLDLAITAPVDGSATLGSQPTHRFTIIDTDPWCHGSGTFRVCYPTAPSSGVLLGSTLNTDAGSPCEAQQPTNWIGNGQPAACVVRATTITQSGSTTVVTGTRPLVLVATNSISIGTLDVSSRRGDSNLGPASPAPVNQCLMFLQTPGNSAGGAGGSFLTAGGDGGIGPGAAMAGRASNPVAAPTVLRAGCHGQQGNSGGETGKGGGAVLLVAGGTIAITGGINASGSGGTGGGDRTGGSGAGSGGMIVLFAQAFSVAGAEVIANGGGGASGGNNNTNGNDGSDPVLSAPTTPAMGGPAGAGGAGGNGFAGGVAATAGAGTGNPNDGGGGGGGGGGYVKSNITLPGATVSAGRFDVP